MSLLAYFDSVKESKGFSLIALIDPDGKTEEQIIQILTNVNQSSFDAIFIGGSTLNPSDFIKGVDIISSNTDLKIIIFRCSACS